MTQEVKNHDPISLIKGVVSARHRKNIELEGYLQSLGVLENHFNVFEQRLRVFESPAAFPEGDVLLEAAQEGLEHMMSCVESLKKLDPSASPQEAVNLVKAAEEGYSLLMKLREVTAEKQEEFEEAYRELSQDEDFENLSEEG